MKSAASLFLLVFAAAFNAFAQRANSPAEIPHATEVRMNDERGTPMLIRLHPGSVTAQTAGAWLNAITGNAGWVLLDEKKAAGTGRLRFRQVYNTVVVEHSRYTVQIENGFATVAHGEWYDIPAINTQPAVAYQNALATALQSLNLASAADSNHGLRIMQREGLARLCYKIDVHSTRPLVRRFVYVDAHDGSVVFSQSRICHTDATGTAFTIYSGWVPLTTDQFAPGQFRLREAGRGIQTLNMNNGSDYAMATDFTDADNTWDDMSMNIRSAFDAHYGAEVSYDYFHQVHSRHSFDDNGALIKCYVNFDAAYNNAFWNGDVLTFGGGSLLPYSPFTPLDVVVHEFAHAVTEHTADFVYNGEPGALHEAFSDIFAIAADHWIHNGNGNWYIGEQVTGTGIPLRDIQQPGSTQNPDTYHGVHWDFLYQQVHNNSTVMSHWFYLLSNGGSGTNDNQAAFSVSGVGIDKAAAIAYRALSVYLTPNSGYADAQFYTIEAAKDLFGPCTNEVLQTVNAWNAVGLPAPYNYMIVAAFAYSDSVFCSAPAAVVFTNQSTGGSSYAWDFGDGTVSTAANPVHTYTISGVYNITLTVSGVSLCNNTAVKTVSSAVFVGNPSGVVNAVCAPGSTNPLASNGVERVRLNNLDRASGNATENYKDFTCLPAAQLVAGSTNTLKINTGSNAAQYVTAWIDYDGDGTFTNNERVLTDSNAVFHSRIIHFPYNPVLNTPLRLRVMAKNNGPILSGCDSPGSGQVEDHAVVFTEANAPPVAAFTGEAPQAPVGQWFQMYDTSGNAPTAWQWFFPGGTPALSQDRDPQVVYTEFGTYDVTLIAMNAYGSDTLLMPGYIVVAPFYELCGGYSHSNMPAGTLRHRTLPHVPFIDGTDCSMLITVPCADTITVEFAGIPPFLTLKDGLNGNGLSLLQGKAFSTTGSLYIRVPVSTASYPGFTATWSSVTSAPAPPVAAFSVTGSTNVNTPLLFTDTSGLRITHHLWEFGDGNVSRLPSPVHRYETAGTYNVSHIVTDCSGATHTAVQALAISGTAVLAVADTVQVNFGCGDTLVYLLVVQNSGNATLRGTALGKNTRTERRVLAHNPGSPTNPFSHYQNMVSVLGTTYPVKQLTTTTTVDPIALRDSLRGKDVLWLPETVSSDQQNNLTFKKLSGVVQQFVRSGGTVMSCSHDPHFIQRFNEQGLFHFAYGSNDDDPEVLEPLSVLVDSLFAPYYQFSGYNYYTTTPGFTRILRSTQNITDRTELGYGHYGLGRAVYAGIDFANGPLPAGPGRVLNNVMREATRHGCPDWLFIDGNDIAALPGANDTITLTFIATGIQSGVHDYYLRLHTNNGAGSLDSILVRMNVNGGASMTVPVACIGFGDVIAGTVANEAMALHNPGCDTLWITSIAASSPDFWVAASPLFIAPGESDTVLVAFSTVTPAPGNANLTISTNAFDTVVCMIANAVTAPMPSFSPLSFNLALDCNNDTTVLLQLTNGGNGTLHYSIQSNAISIPPRILVYMDGVDPDPNGAYANLKNAILQFLPAAHFTETNTGFAGVLADSLVNRDILLLPGKTVAGFSNYTGLASTVQSFVSNGGSVIVCGTPALYANRLFELGLFSGSYFNWSINGLLTAPVPGDSLLSGVTGPYAFSNTVHSMFFTNPDAVPVLMSGANTALAYRAIGNGKAVYVGSEFDAASLMWSRIISNAVRQGDASYGHWLTTPDMDGLVTGNGSHIFPLTVQTHTLSAGTHQAILVVHTNNPVAPFDSIPVSLTVTGGADLTVNDSCLLFDLTFTGYSQTQTVTIHNTGCDTLQIFSAMVVPSAFSTVTPQVIPPHGQADVDVTFAPASAASYNGSLSIVTNAGAETICLSGVGALPPLLQLDPDSLNTSFNVCSDSIHVTFTIHNNGSGILEFTAGTNATAGERRVLVYGYGAMQAAGLGLDNIVQLLGANPSVVTVDTIQSYDAAAFSQALTGKDVVVFPDQDEVPVSLSLYAPSVEAFVRNGGTAVVIGSSNNGLAASQLGLMSVQPVASSANAALQAFHPAHPVMNGIAPSFVAGGASHWQHILDDNAVVLLEKQYGLAGDARHSFYRNIGFGRAYYIGHNFSNPPAALQQLLSNIVTHHGNGYGGTAALNTVNPGAQQSVTVTCYNPQAGVVYYVPIQSNDPAAPHWFALSLSGIDAACSAFSFTNNCNGAVSFQAQNINNATSWHWLFGDGTQSNQQNPQHTYAVPGTYNVTLVTSNALGSDTSHQVVYVNNSSAQIDVNGALLAGAPLEFSVININGADGFSWTFGTGAVSSAETPVYTFVQAGIYPVAVQGVDSNGCGFVALDTLTVLPVGVPVISTNPLCRIYPNPASDVIVVELLSNEPNTAVELVDVLGRNVLTRSMLKRVETIGLDNVAAGVYTVRLSRDGLTVFSARIMIEKTN